LAKPPWVCQAPDGGLHIDARTEGAIDAHVLGELDPDYELNASDYGLPVVSSVWLRHLGSLASLENCHVGRVFYLGRELAAWKTVWSKTRPCLRAEKKTIEKHCPICGTISSWPITGRAYFDDVSIADEAMLATAKGLFVASRIVARPEFRPPRGVHKPETVILKR
jgi:hypothetical protein